MANPFNPQQPARPSFFVGREDELAKFQQNLEQTISGSPANMSIIGNRGMGKTSALEKLEAIASKEHCLVVNISNYESGLVTIPELSTYLANSIKHEIIENAGNLKKGMEWIKDLLGQYKPTAEYLGVKFSLEEQNKATQLILRRELERIWDKIEGDYRAVVVLIDEAEAIEKIKGGLPFLREVFQRLSKTSKYSIVLAGKMNFPERMSEEFSPLNRFFPVMKLRPLLKDEIFDYINRKLDGSSVSFESQLIDKIEEDSQGHPYVVVSLCYGMFNLLQNSEAKATVEKYNRYRNLILQDLDTNFFYPTYHSLSPKGRLIIKKLSDNLSTTTFSYDEAVKVAGSEGSRIAPYIQEMVKKGSLNKPERGQYEFFHKLYFDYIKKLKT